MKIGQVMNRSVTTVTPETPVKEVARLIFSLGISGIPILQNKKLIGIVTEEDILREMHPTIRDIVEDYSKARDFESMERNLVEILETPVKKIMMKTFKSADPEMPLMQAQSLMLLNNFSRLPVVNSKGELIGIISQGDIFRELLRGEMPALEMNRYAAFIGKHYDLMVNWEKRFDYEFPILFRVFKKNNVNSVLDLGSWSGEYTLNLSKEGMPKVLGLDHNQSMVDLAKEKIKKTSMGNKNKVDVMLTDFRNFSSKIDGKYDAAISMGNALPYIPVPLGELFSQVSKSLRKKNAVIILQVLNFQKILKSKNKLLSFIQQQSPDEERNKHIFIEFAEPTDDVNKILHHVIIFDNDGINWNFKGITTIPIFNYTREQIEKELRKVGFKDISVSGNLGEYQGDYGQLSFIEPFDPETSDWLNVVATR